MKNERQLKELIRMPLSEFAEISELFFEEYEIFEGKIFSDFHPRQRVFGGESSRCNGPIAKLGALPTPLSDSLHHQPVLTLLSLVPDYSLP